MGELGVLFSRNAKLTRGAELFVVKHEAARCLRPRHRVSMAYKWLRRAAFEHQQWSAAARIGSRHSKTSPIIKARSARSWPRSFVIVVLSQNWNNFRKSMSHRHQRTWSPRIARASFISVRKALGVLRRICPRHEVEGEHFVSWAVTLRRDRFGIA